MAARKSAATKERIESSRTTSQQSPMNLITNHLSPSETDKTIVALKIDRRKLAKRRWRGIADDGE